MAQLTLEYWEYEGWLIGRLVEVPSIFSQGKTLTELKDKIRDAYKLMVESQQISFFPKSRNRVVLELDS
jgi:predicted RNase H-like HicB family nuclease